MHNNLNKYNQATSSVVFQECLDKLSLDQLLSIHDLMAGEHGSVTDMPWEQYYVTVFGPVMYGRINLADFIIIASALYARVRARRCAAYMDMPDHMTGNPL